MSDKKHDLKGKFVAQCMNGKQQMAMSNRGHLLPCCWCDQEWTLNTPLFQKMLKVSKVSEAENVDEIVLSDEAKEFLATEGYDKEFGARPLRRSIQRLLEDPLSEELLQGKYKAGSTIIISLNKEANTLEFESVEAPDEPPVDFVESES